MKLVYAIVNSDDTYAVNKGLLKAGIRATKLSSTGGFLMSGNTTFLTCSSGQQIRKVVFPDIRKPPVEESFVALMPAFRSPLFTA